MRNKKEILLTLFSLLLCLALTAQQPIIRGTVKDSTGAPVANATLTLEFGQNNTSELLFSLSNAGGMFSFELPHPAPQQAVLKTAALGYTASTRKLDLHSDTNLLITLRKSAVVLEPARVVAKNFIRVKGDTTTININAFSNKNETSVEALVKKLPGFDVDPQGNMKFNGRPIERVLLDGDDLFGNDFKLLTKNLSPDALDKVQVVDNYNDKQLLSGLGKSGKQVLNLKLKNTKSINKSANLTLGGGLPKGWFDNRVNALALSPKFKLVALGNMNNTGTNPFSFVEGERQEHLRPPGAGDDIETQRNLPVTGVNELFYRGIDLKRNNFNNAKIGSVNFLIKASKKAELKGKAYIIGDRNSQQQLNQIQYTASSTPLEVTESNQLKKRQFYQGYSFTANYRPRQKIQLSYAGNYETSDTRFSSSLVLQNKFLQPALQTRQFYFEQRAGYIQRFNNEKALVAELVYASQRLPQTLTVDAASYTQLLGLSAGTGTLLQQQSAFPLRQWLSSVKFLGKHKNDDYSIGAGYNRFSRDYVTTLSAIQQNGAVENTGAAFNNNYKIYNNRFFAEAVYSKSRKHISFSANTVWNAEILSIDNPQNNNLLLKERFSYFQHRLNLGYKTNTWGKFSLQYIYKNKLPLFTDLMPGMRLSTYRSFDKGTAVFERLDDHSISVNYSLVDYYQKQMMLFAGILYNTNPNAYLRNLLPGASYDINLRTVKPVNNNGFMMYARIEKYFDALQGNLVADANHYRARFVSQSAGTDVFTRLNNTSLKLAFKSVWKNWLNIQLNSTVRFTAQQNEVLGKKSSLRNHFIENRANCYITPKNKKINLELAAEQYFLPNGNKTNSLLFADINLQYTVVSNKLVLNLLANNVFNNRQLSFQNISLLQVNNQTFNLLPAYVMLKVFYKF
jgi:hypothetical protein